MPDCFISYATCDQRLADYVHEQLKLQKIETFMASISLKPGDHWSTSIRDNLQQSSWVVFLASRQACASPWVQQEIGMAIGAGKKLITVVWEFSPTELPGWAKESQAVDLRGKSIDALRQQIETLAASIKQSKQQGFMILGAIVLGLWAATR